MVDYQNLIDIGLATDRQTLTRRLVAAAESMGFGLASGVLIRGRFGSSNALIESFGNPPDAFSEASKSLDRGLHDPLMTALLAKPGHMTYGEDLYINAGATDHWDCQSAFGYRHGVSMSIHSQTHAEAFLFGVDRPDALPTGAELLRLQANLQMIAMHAREAMDRLTQVAKPAGPQVDLSSKEADALQRVAATVYAKRGGLVAMSRVDSPHLRVAVRKLGAQGLPGAVLRAIEEGIIDR